ncbi:Protein cueball [Aphelenchoides besseyi]|nr:Protein cueball [Aphelenchoides besseyi]
MNQITCCNLGVPTVPENLVRNFTLIPSDYTIEERTVDDVTMNCRDFEVRYLARRLRVLSDTDNDLDAEVPLRCKCSETPTTHSLDLNCRRLPDCKNHGVRASAAPHQCVCPVPFFGDRCEKYCDQGQRLIGHNGRNYCSCIPFYQGEECRDMLCLNGGREDNGRCICPPQYLGFHCEINTNHTGSGSRFQRFGDQGSEMFTRDVSGSIFSLILICVLVLSVYLLLKHRMQTRYLNRRPDLLGACNFPVPASVVNASGPGNCLTSARRSDLLSPDDPRLYSFRPVNAHDHGPPPYFQHRGRRGRDVLPPLPPSYDDAIKLPPLRNNVHLDQNAEVDERTDLSSRNARAESTPTVSSQNSSQNVVVENVSTSSPTGGEAIVATVRGTEMVRSCTPASMAVSTRNSDAGSVTADEQAETESIASTGSSASTTSKDEN